MPRKIRNSFFIQVFTLALGILCFVVAVTIFLFWTSADSHFEMDRLTVVTKGRSGTYKTPYGVIEFTHTKQPINRFEHNLYFDPDIKMYRANTEQALADLKHTRRNLHLLAP